MKNITYINAGAGSGKTYRLTEEMTAKVEGGFCTPSQIIASTFTKAAAADLKKNAREKFLKHGLYAEASELDSANIGTVHSIGLLYIQKYWYKLGLSASVGAIDDNAKAGYLDRTLTKVVTDEDMTFFREYVEKYDLKKSQSTRKDYNFWRDNVIKVVETASAFGINDFNVSEKKSLELAELLLGDNVMYADCIRRIFSIASRWSALFDKFKEEHGLIEFNDMENKFIQLLQDKDVREDISSSVKYVFVDEFQDSNPKQIKIFDLLSDLVEHSYWVGDPKQAIYGFRGCDTLLVQAVTDRIIEGKANKAESMDYDTLKESRRSVKPLVDTTSAVFTKVFDKMKSEMVVLKAHRNENLPDNAPALWHWEQLKTKEPGKTRATVSKSKLFNSIACQVRDMIDGNGEIKYVIDKMTGNSRPVECSDIAILARSNADVGLITNALLEKDIPVVFESTAGCDSKELRLVRLLLNYMVDESPLLKAEIAHLLFDVKTEDVLQDKEKALQIPEFEKLDKLKERMEASSVSEIVKTLILELDLFNRCQKWGSAASRKRVLQALISDSQTFDAQAGSFGEASSIEHYLLHLDKDGVVIGEGFFQNGVHVMTYHKSKGLQWNIVVLCSLDDDLSNEKSNIKRFAVGVNYVREDKPNAGNLYADYYVTCMPRFMSSDKSNLTDEMMKKVDSLTIYQQYAERIEQEARRLLYVGVTRARDYLITTSLEDKKMTWLTISGIDSTIDKKVNGDYQPIWGTGKDISNSKFVSVNDDGNYKRQPEPAEYGCRMSKTLVQPIEDKYLSPSKIKDSALEDTVNASLLYPDKAESSAVISVGNGDEYDVMGTCIHNIFAIYEKRVERKDMIGKAKSIIKAYGMETMLPKAESIVDSIELFYSVMEKHYGKAHKLEHEVPFRHDIGDQIISGEMDLLWYTSPKECVLVDLKNYPGTISHVLNKADGEYVGKYAAQLDAYKAALLKAGLNVKAKLIYYSVIGCLVELK